MTLTDASVNSGVAITIRAHAVDETIEVFSNVADTCKNNLSDTFANRLSEGYYTGFKNPEFPIDGYLYIGEDSTNYLTLTLLHSLCASGTIKTFVSDLTGTVKVMIKNVSLHYDYANNTNGVADLKITFLRVKDV